MNDVPEQPAQKPEQPPSVARFYRLVDWRTFAVTAVVIFIGYLLTMSPDVTLEDSGELATGSMYAGVPHPPGYPVWTVITWVFTKLVPVSTIAYRVALASAVAAALACGLLAMIVSRGSSLMLQAMDGLQGLEPRRQNALCAVAGFVAAMLLGYNGFMWSQAVIVEVYPLSVLSFLALLSCLLRWIYAPQQRRWLYWAAFLFGVSITNHQTLLVAAMGVEIAIIAGEPKLGRDLLAVNTICWLGGLFLKANHAIATFDTPPGSADLNVMFVIFNLVGLLSFGGLMALVFKTRGLLTEWKALLAMVALWCAGVGLYFYMPLASMTNPPMNWGYPRTVDGFFHVLSRGQYNKIDPTNFLHDPSRLLNQTVMYFSGAADEFTFVYLLLALVPFCFLLKMRERERAWMIGLAGVFACLAFLLMILLNPSPDRQTQELVKVFFTSSYVPVAIWIGYGLSLIGAWLACDYQRCRFWAMVGAGALLAVALAELVQSILHAFVGLDAHVQDVPGCGGVFGAVSVLAYGGRHLFERGLGSLPVWGSLLVLVVVLCFLATLFFARKGLRLGWILALFAVAPLASVISHWADNEQRGHLFGFWFGHDMFSPPFRIYPEMERDAVLFGGTDPGRFCPTYMIFCESFTPPQKRIDPQFDRRDVYLITQNALADGTYLNYIRAHYNRSAQTDPPFFQNFLPYVFPKIFHQPTACLKWLDAIFETLGARIERRRRTSTSWFHEGDFLHAQSFAAKLLGNDPQDPLAQFLYSKLGLETRELLAANASAGAAQRALARDFNAILQGGSIFTAERFIKVRLPVLLREAAQAAQLPSTLVRLNRRLLEEAYPAEIARSPGGVFPDTEIQTPSGEESQQCSNEYISDAMRRVQHDRDFPNEPPQVQPGEVVQLSGGQVQFGGQIAVFAINGLLAKRIFDRNPNHEFYVEESFPLAWMYPYLTPFGIIMKVNRQPLPEITPQVVEKDHAFWSRYSARLTGNWITYNTSVQDLCAFVERIYLQHDSREFTGDPAFLRDDDAQKSFAKLRSSIGGVYQWRVDHAAAAPERQRMFQEAEFAFKQSFAFCPYNGETLFHYVQLLLRVNRVADAILLAETALKLDPYNAQTAGLLRNLRDSSKAAPMTVEAFVAGIQKALDAHHYDQAKQMIDQLLNLPQATSALLLQVAQLYAQTGALAKAEEAMAKAVKLEPSSPANWYNLATLQAGQGKAASAAESLKRAFALNAAELATNSKALNLPNFVRTDPNFDFIRQAPEFKEAVK